MNYDEAIAHHRAAIKSIEDRQRADREALRKSVVPVYKFTFLPTSKKPYGGIYDPSCEFFTLKGEVINFEECKAAGHTLHVGGMDYLYNGATGRVVMSIGGGTVYISDWEHKDREKVRLAMLELSDFLATNPDGGDVTDIVNRYRK